MALPGQHAPNLNRGFSSPVHLQQPVRCLAQRHGKRVLKAYASQSTEVPGMVYSLGEALFGT